MQERRINMELFRLWFVAIIVLVIVSTALSQTIPQFSSNRKPDAHLKIEQIGHSLRRTKQNHSNLIDESNATSKKRINEQSDAEGSDDSIQTDTANKPHSRKKRLIWITDDGRLALPPGTVLSITPTLSLPLVRYPLDGFLSNMTMSFPLTIDFDKLGLTDNENPLGAVPPLFARSMGRAAGTYLADYIGDYLISRRTRSVAESEGEDFMTISKQKNPTLPDAQKHAFHGGERAILYGIAEDLLTTFGMDGKACMLRAICEIHSKKSLDHLGLFGEIAKLFFTATKSNYAHLLTEYVTAQQIGEGKRGPFECFPYYKKCSKSIFKLGKETNKYSESSAEESDTEKDNENIENIIELDGIENEIRSNNNKNGAHSVFNM